MKLKSVDYKLDKLYNIAGHMYQSDAFSFGWKPNTNPRAIQYIDAMKIMLMKDMIDAIKHNKSISYSE